MPSQPPASLQRWAPMLQKPTHSEEWQIASACWGERKAIDFVWKNFMLVLFIISRRAMKSSKAKSITATLGEARAALWLMSNRQVSRGDALGLELLLVPLPAGLDPCRPRLLSVQLLRQLPQSTALRPQCGQGWTAVKLDQLICTPRSWEVGARAS